MFATVRTPPPATVRNRPQPFATVRVQNRLLRPFAWHAWHFVTFQHVSRRVESRFVKQIILPRFQKMRCIFRDRRSTLRSPISFCMAGRRRNTFDVSCCVFSANRIVSAARSGDKVQNPWQAWHFVTCDENRRKPRTKR